MVAFSNLKSLSTRLVTHYKQPMLLMKQQTMQKVLIAKSRAKKRLLRKHQPPQTHLQIVPYPIQISCYIIQNYVIKIQTYDFRIQNYVILIKIYGFSIQNYVILIKIYCFRIQIYCICIQIYGFRLLNFSKKHQRKPNSRKKLHKSLELKNILQER